MNERTATVFAIWYSRHGHSFLNEALAFDAWQAAWEARGKHDAEVCRSMQFSYLNGPGKARGNDAYSYGEGEECAQAIEEQA